MQTQATDQDLLRHMGWETAPLLGAGGEARVYDLGDGRVARVIRDGAQRDQVLARAELLREIAAGAETLPFQTPEVLDIIERDGRLAMLERRLDGSPLSLALASATHSRRENLLASYLETALQLQDIAVPRHWFGPLIGDRALRADSWQVFLQVRLLRSSQTCPADLREAVLDPSGRALPDVATPRLVHLDYFADNVLVADGAVSAVLDFSVTSLAGDPRLDAWSAVAYLDPEITPSATDDDRRFAHDWLAAAGLETDYPAARRWLAAYWSHAADDLTLMGWCRRILMTDRS